MITPGRPTRLGRISGAVACMWCVAALGASSPVSAEVMMGGKHQLEVSIADGFGAALEDGASLGFHLDQQLVLEAVGRTTDGWQLQASYDSQLPPAERLRMSAERPGLHVGAGQVAPSGGGERMGWERRLLGVEFQVDVGAGSLGGAAGTPLGVPVPFSMRGDGGRGPFALGPGPAVVGSLVVEVNGLRLEEGFDYTFDADLAQVTFHDPVPSTSVLTGSYEVEDEGRRAFGFKGDFAAERWQFGVHGALEDRADPKGAVDPVGGYPDRLANIGVSVGHRGSVDWRVERSASLATADETTDQAGSWSGGWSVPAGRWAISGAVYRIEPGFQAVGKAPRSGEVEIAAEAAYRGDGYRAVSSFSRLMIDGDAGASPLERLTVGQRFEAGSRRLSFQGGTIRLGDATGRHGGASMGWADGRWWVDASWSGQEIAVKLDDDLAATRRLHAASGRSWERGSAELEWVDESVDAGDGAEDRRTLQLDLSGATSPERRIRALTLWSQTDRGDRVADRVFFSLSGRTVNDSQTREVKVGPLQTWEVEWDRSVASEGAASIRTAAGASYATGGVLVDLEAGVGRSESQRVQRAVQAAVTSLADPGQRLAWSWFDPGEGAPRRRVAIAAAQRPSGIVTLRETVEAGHLEAFPTTLDVGSHGEPPAPDPGARVRVEWEWKADAWSVTTGSGWTHRLAGDGFARPDSSWQADLSLAWDSGDVWDIEGRVTQKREISGGEWRTTSRIESELGWWWTRSSRLSFALERAVAWEAQASVGAYTRASWTMESYF